MSLAAGARLGPYEILGLIGAGGMGEVYKANDTRLDRAVAIKILPDNFSADPDRRARFEREGKAISSLNHPHICTLYDVGHQDGIDYLVMEYVEGETLQERLKKGALPFEQALRCGIEIADALGKAQRQGVVHRDLKPGNVMLTKAGAKLLDFGLAKLQPIGWPVVQALSGLSTATHGEPLTEKGTILGTLCYMAPEQLEGKEADQRADIWALGCVLYEMVTGRRAFDAGSQAALISGILERHPPPITSLQPMAPSALDHAVTTCLSKDPDDRWQSAADLKRELKWIGEALSQASAVGSGTNRPSGLSLIARQFSTWVAVGLLVILAGLAIRSLRPRESPGELSDRLMINLPADAPMAPPASLSQTGDGRPSLALSRDGRRLVYVALVGNRTRLFVRDMATAEINPIPGTEDAYRPFLSPDGEWVAFFADGRLKKAALASGEIVVLTEAHGPGGSWGEDGVLYFNTNEGGGIYKIAASGGDVQLVFAGQFLWPEILPSGRGLLFSDLRGGIYLLKEGRIERICDGFYPHYAPNGHLLVAELGKLLAVPFDLSSLKVTGTPVTLLRDLRTELFGGAQYAFSQDGTLVYLSGTDSQVASLVWVDRRGKAEPLGLPPAVFGPFSLSPDGSKLAIPVFEGSGADIWLYDISRGTRTRFTFSSGTGPPRLNSNPVWTPDGRNIVYTSYSLVASASNSSELLGHLFWKRADSTREAVQLTPDAPLRPVSGSFTPDGSVLALYATSRDTGFDLWTLRLGGVDPYTAAPLRPEVFLQTRFVESFPRLSPDGKWVAYMSDESGRREVYVRPFPGPGEKVQISTDGGLRPSWHPNGREIFYEFRNQWYAVEVSPFPQFKAGKPQLLFEGPYIGVPGFSYALAPDGERFLVLENRDQFKARTDLTVVTHFFNEIHRRIAARKN